MKLRIHANEIICDPCAAGLSFALGAFDQSPYGLLFRRFVNWGQDITRDYVRSFEAHRALIELRLGDKVVIVTPTPGYALTDEPSPKDSSSIAAKSSRLGNAVVAIKKCSSSISVSAAGRTNMVGFRRADLVKPYAAGSGGGRVRMKRSRNLARLSSSLMSNSVSGMCRRSDRRSQRIRRFRSEA